MHRHSIMLQGRITIKAVETNQVYNSLFSYLYINQKMLL